MLFVFRAQFFHVISPPAATWPMMGASSADLIENTPAQRA